MRPPGGQDPRKFGLAVMLGQAGLEMVAPIALGVLLDRWLNTMPWLTVPGAVVGFVGGLGHMPSRATRLNAASPPPPARPGAPPSPGPNTPQAEKEPPSGRGSPCRPPHHPIPGPPWPASSWVRSSFGW